MNLLILTWNGTSINNGSPFYADFPLGQKVNISGNVVTTPRANNYPTINGVVPNSATITIRIRIAPGQSIDTNREALKGYFNFEDGIRHNLIAEDGSGGTQWYLTGIVRQVTYEGQNRNSFFVMIQVEYPYWRLVTAGDTTWSVTASGQTQAVTNSGNINAKPKFTLTPTVTKTGGLSYRRHVAIYNNLDVSYNEPLDITSGGIDTATLTTAKMQADGDDFRVWKQNTEVDRWLDAMDTANTKCWVNENLPPRYEATLSGTLPNNGTTVAVPFKQTRANLAVLQFLKSATENYFMIGTEIFRYTPANVNLVTYQIASCARAQKGSSYAAHSDGDTIRYISLLQILYGDSSLAAPDVNNDNKPLFSLASTNGAWTWANFYDTSNPRPGAWRGEVLASRTGLSYVYTDADNTFVNPSEALGLAMIGAMDFQVQNETGTLAWVFSHPATITQIVYSGDKYATGSWPAIIGLQYLQTNTAWFTSDNHSVPATLYAWEAFGPTTTAFSSPYPDTLRFVIDGLLSSVIGEAALIQFDTVTATFTTANLPTISVSAEETINFFDFTLTNNTTSEYITCRVPCAVNDTLTIDCENKTAYLGDGSPVAVTLSSDRAEWLDMRPGANTFKFDDTGTNAVTVHVIHRDRTL